MKFLNFLMYLNAVAAFSGFFVMAAGADSSVIVFVIGFLIFACCASAAQMLKNHMEWKQKQREREAVKRYLRDLKKKGGASDE